MPGRYFGHRRRGEGSRSGKPAVIVGVQKQPGANTIEVTARLDRALDTLQEELPAGFTIDRRIFRQSDFIEVAVDNVIKALRDGGILVTVPSGSDVESLRRAAGNRVRVTGILVEPDRTGLEAIAVLVERGALRPHVARTFPLAEASRAHELGESGRIGGGKLVLTTTETAG